MTNLYRLFSLLLPTFFGLLTSCALLGPTATWHPPLVLPTDSVGAQPTLIYAKNYYAGSYKDRSDRRAQGGTFVTKANAPVATGTSQAQDFTRAGQQGGAVAAAPGASAGATTHTGLPNWALVAGGIVLLLGLAYRFRAKLFPG